MFYNFIRLLRIFAILYKRGALFLLDDLKILPKFFVTILSIFAIHTRSLSTGVRIRLILEDLGPFFIKFGQTLATRADLVGYDVAQELSKLQDKLEPNLTKSSVSELIEKELGENVDKLFRHFSDKPVAAASIAEVFKAEDFYGNKLAVKILKPGIEKEFDKDLKLFFAIAQIIQKRFKNSKRFRLIEIVKSFERTINIEMDFTLEAAAASELSENNSKKSGIYIPKIFWDKVSKKILTIEWVEGFPINNVGELKKQKINIKKVIYNFTHMFLNQAYKHGFFHADLHPGNVLVRKDGSIALIDFGIIGRLDRKTKVYLAEILRGFITKNYMHVAKIHFDAGYVPKKYSLEEFAQACRAIGEPIVGMSANETSVGTLLTRLFKLTRDFDMPVQPQLLLVQKTTVVVEGIISSLDKDANMWNIADPWVKEWAKQNIGFDAKIMDFIEDLVEFIKESNKRPAEKEVIEVTKTSMKVKIFIITLSVLSGILIADKIL
ncbi:MAG: 2-polyprenylphenol 6-hydroxylase [Alphaproteobacteria bacterium]|nr:2-polyprenylphenol 6-hydroxylase [Alphaproteobacteria bacterium]